MGAAAERERALACRQGAQDRGPTSIF
jgi:hypothetical protein